MGARRPQPGVEHALAGEQGLSFRAQERDVGALTIVLAREGIGILALTPELATLEDLFFRLTEGGEGAVLGDWDASRGGSAGRSEETEQARLTPAGGLGETGGVR